MQTASPFRLLLVRIKYLLVIAFGLGLLAQAAAAGPSIFLVRHAEKASDADVETNDPDLSEAGQARADALAQILKDARIKSVYATEFKRTQMTARPTAQGAGIDVTVVPAKESSALLAKLKTADGNVLLVGHSNTLPDIIKALGVQEVVTIEDADYDNLFVLTPGSARSLLRLHYANCSRQGH